MSEICVIGSQIDRHLDTEEKQDALTRFTEELAEEKQKELLFTKAGMSELLAELSAHDWSRLAENLSKLAYKQATLFDNPGQDICLDQTARQVFYDLNMVARMMAKRIAQNEAPEQFIARHRPEPDYDD